ncbi:MAG: hypothetical protein RR214_08395, partial [Synergistaceae bacterium]
MEYKAEFFVNGLIIGRMNENHAGRSVPDYSENVFVLSEEELASVAQNKEKDPKWGKCWRKRFYSALEDHGIITRYRYIAEGLDLRMVLERAGFTEEEIRGDIQFAASHFKVIVESPSDNRFCWDDAGDVSSAPAILAFQTSLVSEDGTTLSRKNTSPYPRLIFGQQTAEEINKCSFVCSLRKVQSAAQKPAVRIYKDGILWCEPTLPDLLMLKQNEAMFDLEGDSVLCVGTDIALL